MVWIHLAMVKLTFMKAMLSHGATAGPHVHGPQAVDNVGNQMPPTYTDAQVRIQIPFPVLHILPSVNAQNLVVYRLAGSYHEAV